MSLGSTTKNGPSTQLSMAHIVTLRAVSKTMVVIWVCFMCLVVVLYPTPALTLCDGHTDLLAISQCNVIFGTFLDTLSL